MDNLANRIVLDALEEQADARAAWEAVAYCVEQGVPFPDWVTRYLGDTAAGLLDYLANRDERPPAVLPQVLGFVGMPKRVPQTDPLHDRHEVYEEINELLRSGHFRSVASAAKHYSETILNGTHAPETVRSWYNSVKKQVTG